jgi:hypothetical protein
MWTLGRAWTYMQFSMRLLRINAPLAAEAL